jgi:predicted NBD/HSP70 family sugar kinase
MGDTRRANAMKRLNRSAVLRAIAEQERASRITVAAMTGLSRATITRMVEELIRAGVVTIVGSYHSGAVGRKAALLAINPAGGRIVGVHLGGWSNDVGLLTLGGELYAEAHLPLIENQAIERVLPRVFAAVDALLTEDHTTAPLLGIGIATGGDIDSARGRVRTHAQHGWRDVPLRDHFETRYGVHAAVANTFQAMAWAEALFARDTDGGSLLFANCSALIGAGFAQQRLIDHGTPDTAGQLGHTRFGESEEPCVCGKRGCLQATVSDGALVARALAVLPEMDGAGDTPPRTIRRLAELALAGHPHARDLFEMRARTLAPAVAALVNTLGPAVLVLGVSDTAYADQEFAGIAAAVREHLYPPLRGRVRMRPVTGPRAQGGARAAAAAVLRDLYSPLLDLSPAAAGALVPVIGTPCVGDADAR